MSYIMYASMYFDIKRKHDPDKMWIPGYDIRTVINKIMEKTGFTSYFRVHNMDDVEKFAKTIVEAKEGDIITLIGSDEDETISIDEWADILGTINYCFYFCSFHIVLGVIYI